MFKIEKTHKKNTSKKSFQFSLEVKHQEMCNYFLETYKNIDNLKKQLNEIKTELFELDNLKFKTPNEYCKYSILLDQKRNIKDRLLLVLNKSEESRYFIAVSNILKEYYIIKKELTLISKQYSSMENSVESLSLNEEPLPDSSSLIKNKKKIVTQYISELRKLEFVPFELDLSYKDLLIDMSCKCDNSNIIDDPEQGISVCINCGNVLESVIYSDYGFSDSERVDTPSTPFSYKRINHFKDRLAQFQAKECIYIPNEIYEKLKIEIKKERVNIKNLKMSKVREYLKKIGASNYYDNIQHIIEHLSGTQLPKLDARMEETLKIRFLEAVEVYDDFKEIAGMGRSNFLKYNYVLYQLCKIEGYTQFLPYLSLFKDPLKLQIHDKVWKGMCEKLCWTFYPTI